MKLLVLAVGKPQTTQLEAALADYTRRLRRWVLPEWKFVATSGIDKESDQLLRLIPVSADVTLLDERGTSWSTPALAAHLEVLQNQSAKQAVFIIGGAHGVSDAVRERADTIWKLSDLVFPHELVRLILIEQLYRAYDLNHGGNYHHA